MAKKLSLYSFRRKYSRSPFDNTELAELVVTGLADQEPLVGKAVEYLKALEAFNGALEEARIERG